MSENKDTHKGHRQRMRERALSEGLDGFNQHQVMELLLFYAIPMKDVSELAHALVNRFGSVQGVLSASAEELTEVDGVGKRVADWLGRLGELVEAYGALTAKDRPQIGNFRTTFDFCRKHVGAAPSTWQICMTPSGMVQMFTEICNSQQWGDAETLKHALDDVLSVQARNVIIVEYVPEDVPHIEAADCDFAKQYGRILWLMGGELLDVVLVGTTQIVSLNREGQYDRTQFGKARSMLSERYLREEAAMMDYGEDLPVSDNGL